MDKTPNYSLSQWVKSDQVRMEDFNADNAKIDAAIKAVDEKASGKADAAVVDGLSGTVAGHTAALAKRGNCQIYTTSYVGSGKSGQSNPNRLTFPGKPLLVAIMSTEEASFYILIRGCERTAYLGGSNYVVLPTWGDNWVSWFSPDTAYGQLNISGKTYNVVAFYAKD